MAQTTKQIPGTVTITDTWTCDWCGGDMHETVLPYYRLGPGGGRSFRLWFEGCLVRLSGVATVTTTVRQWSVEDLCDPCVDRLHQWLVEQGVSLIEKEFVL